MCLTGAAGCVLTHDPHGMFCNICFVTKLLNHWQDGKCCGSWQCQKGEGYSWWFIAWYHSEWSCQGQSYWGWFHWPIGLHVAQWLVKTCINDLILTFIQQWLQGIDVLTLKDFQHVQPGHILLFFILWHCWMACHVYVMWPRPHQDVMHAEHCCFLQGGPTVSHFSTPDNKMLQSVFNNLQ